MPAPAAPLIEMLQLASAAFDEGYSALTEAKAADGETGRPLLAYGNQVIAGGLKQVEVAARRYMLATEYSNPSAPRLILSDAAFRAHVSQCAAKLEAAAPAISVAARRIPVALRNWLNTPSAAPLVAMQADAAVRLAKTRAGRAA